MVRAMRADEVVLFEIQRVDHFSTVRAFPPKVIWDGVPILGSALETWFFENPHAGDYEVVS